MDLSGVTADVVVPVRSDPAGVHGPTRSQTRGPHWRRSSQGLYLPASVDADAPAQRIVEVAAALPEDAAITGWAALHWRRAQWFGGLLPDGTLRRVPAWTGHNRRCRVPPAGRATEEWLAPADVEVVDGLRVTTALVAASFEARTARSLPAAVAVLDMAAYDDHVSLSEMAQFIASRLAGKRRVRQLRAALALADENSWSPQESVMRVLWCLEAGASRPRCNVPIFDLDGRHLLTPDLLDVQRGVAGEYDGDDHLDRARKDADVEREELYRQLGIERVTMTAADRRRPSALVARIRGAYGRARSSSGRRGWTVEQPAWWCDTSTVVGRRGLSPYERSLWLRRRRLP